MGEFQGKGDKIAIDNKYVAREKERKKRKKFKTFSSMISLYIALILILSLSHKWKMLHVFLIMRMCLAKEFHSRKFRVVEYTLRSWMMMHKKDLYEFPLTKVFCLYLKMECFAPATRRKRRRENMRERRRARGKFQCEDELLASNLDNDSHSYVLLWRHIYPSLVFSFFSLRFSKLL